MMLVAVLAVGVVAYHCSAFILYRLLDDLILLAPGGRAVFVGPTECALPYFTNELRLLLPVPSLVLAS